MRPVLIACATAGLLTGLLSLRGHAEPVRGPDPSRPGAAEPALPLPAGLSHGIQGFVVTPVRIVFEGRRRNASLAVVNTGSVPTAHRVTLVRMRMSGTGEIQPVDAPRPGEAFADTLVRFSPRQFEIGPRASQTIRLQLRKPADLPDGEYRSHLLVQEIPRLAESASSTRPRDPADLGLEIRLRPVFGAAIPVIVRQGATSASVSLEDVRFQAPASAGEPPSVYLKIVRSGNRSVYGDVEWRYVRDGARPRLAGRMRGVAVYTPNRERLVRIPVPETRSRAARDGRLVVSFVESGSDVPMVAEASLILP